MKAKQAKKNKQWKDKLAKRQNKTEFKSAAGGKKKFNKPLADPETFEEDEELQIEKTDEARVTWGGNDVSFATENEAAEDDGDFGNAKDGNNWQKKKKSGGFQSMGLSPQVLKGILRRGYKVPTPIQRKAIPVILEGRDVVAMARTGSGKTAAFLIPMLEKLQQSKTNIGEKVKYPRGLILSPTRELATQTMKFFRELGKFLDLKVISILGGESMDSQYSALHDKPDVIIATPGRFMHLCVEMDYKLDGVEYVVFDEADRLFEMGFGEQVTEILKRLADSRQTVMFSATLPRVLVDFTKAGLHDPTLIRLDVDTKLPDRLKLTHVACRSEDKLAMLLYLLKNEIDSRDQTIVFVATKHHVEYLHMLMDEASISNCFIYSSLDPDARKTSLENFRNGKTNVMLVTDIAARGIDIPILDNVINFHFPAKPKLFMHRVGRVARAGRSGTAISIVSPEEVAFLLDFHLFLGKPLVTAVSSGTDDGTGVLLARPPQELIDQERSYVRSLHDNRAELESLAKVAKNGYSQYMKSRPNASTESNRRAKELEVSKMCVHPIFGTAFKAEALDSFISQIHNYRSRSTIFEVGPRAGSDVFKIMQEKRLKDQKIVEKRRTMKPLIDLPTTEGTTKKEDMYINYLPDDHHTEEGLSVSSTFDKQLQDTVMDITGDDAHKLKDMMKQQHWDRKKKKFVTVGSDNKPKKKIKTESGTWISASYKSDSYKRWQQKSKISQQMEVTEGDSDDDSFAKNSRHDVNQRPVMSKKLIKTGKNEAPADGKGGRRIKSELKRPEQILKARKIKEAKKMKGMPKTKRKSMVGGKKGPPIKVGKGGKFGGGAKAGGSKAGGKFNKFKKR